jgi:hypothetical protein
LPEGLVPPTAVDVLLDAGQAEGLAGPGEHAGTLGYQIFDAGTRGGGVVEDFDGETVCSQRSGGPLQTLCGRRAANDVVGIGVVMVKPPVFSQRYDNVTARNVRRRANLTFRCAAWSDW